MEIHRNGHILTINWQTEVLTKSFPPWVPLSSLAKRREQYCAASLCQRYGVKWENDYEHALETSDALVKCKLLLLVPISV